MITHLNPQPLNLQTIANPFVGEWDIDQVFQMEVLNGDDPAVQGQLIFGYYDNEQDCFILEMWSNGETTYCKANSHASLRPLLDLAYGANAGYEFVEKVADNGDPFPEDDNDVLNLLLEDLQGGSLTVKVWGGIFNPPLYVPQGAIAQYAAAVLAAIGEAPALPLPPHEWAAPPAAPPAELPPLPAALPILPFIYDDPVEEALEAQQDQEALEAQVVEPIQAAAESIQPQPQEDDPQEDDPAV